MLTFLFWNLGGRDLSHSIGRLVERHRVDVVVLAEATAPAFEDELLSPARNADEPLRSLQLLPSACERIKTYSGVAQTVTPPLGEDERYSIRRFTMPDSEDILLVGVHLASKREMEAPSQYDLVIPLCHDIQQAESQVGHQRTLVVGDMNMNPFEPGMVSAMRFHAVSSKEVARRGFRTVQRRQYPFFYNPMWRFFGDHENRPPGTYYYRKAESTCYFWNIFDQVLLRPALLDFWDDQSLQILTADGETSFLTRNGTPNARTASDHLPILFRLRDGKENE